MPRLVLIMIKRRYRFHDSFISACCSIFAFLGKVKGHKFRLAFKSCRVRFGEALFHKPLILKAASQISHHLEIGCAAEEFGERRVGSHEQ
jgi:hypothetical protein